MTKGEYKTYFQVTKGTGTLWVTWGLIIVSILEKSDRVFLYVALWLRHDSDLIMNEW